MCLYSKNNYVKINITNIANIPCVYFIGNYEYLYRLYSAIASHVGFFFHLFACKYLSLFALSNHACTFIFDIINFYYNLSNAYY